MTLPEKLSLESFIVKLAMAAAGLVLLFSVFNGYVLLTITLRSVFSFFLIYFLGISLLRLWEKFSPQPPPENNVSSKIDVILGDIAALENELDLSFDHQGRTTAGTYGRIIPGQINPDMQKVLTDVEKQAEFVRRMGLEE